MIRDREAPTLTEELCRWVSVEARRQNGWEVLGIDCTSGSDGVIRFHREGVNVSSGSGRNYGTAHFATDGSDVVGFEWEHYDLTYAESRADFAKRVEAGR